MKFNFYLFFSISINVVLSEIAKVQKISDKEMRVYNEYNEKLVDQYSKLFQNIEDGDRILQAYDGRVESISESDGVLSKLVYYIGRLGKLCYPDIGCFSSREFLYGVDRLPVLPTPPNYIHPIFYMHTPDNKIHAYHLRYNSTDTEFLKSPFNPKFRTIVVIHGFRSGLEPWMEDIRDLIFYQKENRYNLILINWEKGAKVPNYYLAASNTRIVGAMVAYFINKICETFNTTNDMFYLVGHSLGSYIMGYAGERLFNPKVSRITALDPAGPGFRINSGLKPTDASQVDVIHTDMAEFILEGLGSSDNIGHVDFFPNGGKLQPGCPATSGVVNMVKALAANEEMSCSHNRAFSLFASLGKPYQKCLPVGYSCDSWETFLEGRCANCGKRNDKCHLMGSYLRYWEQIVFNSRNTNLKGQRFYLNTASHEEYCIYHYQIAFHFSNSSSPGSGELLINISAIIDGESKVLSISRILSKTVPGFVHTLIVTFKFLIEKIEKVSIEWHGTKQSDYWSREVPKTPIVKINFIEVNYMSHIVKGVREEHSMILCPQRGRQPISEGEKFDFVECLDSKPERLARETSYLNLKPITIREDIISVDYEMIDIVHHKLYRSNFLTYRPSQR